MSHGVPTTTSWMTSHGVPTGIYMPIGTKLRSKLLVCHASYKFGEQLLKHCFQFTVGDYSRVIEWLTVGDYTSVLSNYIFCEQIAFSLPWVTTPVLSNYIFCEQIFNNCFRLTVGDYSRVIEWLTVVDDSRIFNFYILRPASDWDGGGVW